MKRALDFVLGNWPLKLAAVVLATILYAGLAVSADALVWRGQIEIQPFKQPTSAVLLGRLPPVTSVRYFASDPVAASVLSAESFSATADLSRAERQPNSPLWAVPVSVTAVDRRIRVVGFIPERILVQLDPLVSHTVKVQVDRGTLPAGLDVRDPVVSQSTVTVFGPESVIRLVAAAEARVQIQPAGLSIDQAVDLIAVDAQGQQLSPVRIEPEAVRVTIKVGSQLSTRALPINPVTQGTPAPGVEVVAVTVEPALVSIEGEPDTLVPIRAIPTATLDISGITTDITATVKLALPAGVVAIAIDSVRITVQVRQVTATRAVNVGIVLEGARPDRTYRIATESVVVTLGGPVAALGAFDPARFVASVDVADLAAGVADAIVRVVPPNGLSVVAVSPDRVQVTVELPPTPAPTPTAEPSPSVSPVPTAGPTESASPTPTESPTTSP